MDRIGLLSTMTTSFILGVCIVPAAAALTSHPNTSGELPIRHDTRYVAHQIPGETPWDSPSKAEPNQGPWTKSSCRRVSGLSTLCMSTAKIATTRLPTNNG